MMYTIKEKIITLSFLLLSSVLLTACGGGASEPGTSGRAAFDPEFNVVVRTAPFLYHGVWRHEYAFVPLRFEIELEPEEVVSKIEWTQIDDGPQVTILSGDTDLAYFNSHDIGNDADMTFEVNVTTTTQEGTNRTGSSQINVSVKEVWNPDREFYLFAGPEEEFAVYAGEDINLFAMITGEFNEVEWEILQGVDHPELETDVIDPVINTNGGDLTHEFILLEATVTFADGSKQSDRTRIEILDPDADPETEED